MIRFSSFLAVCGLACVLGFGAAAWSRAQQPEARESVSPKKALRGRLLKLRTEVEALRIEHKAVRVVLQEMTTRSERIDFLKSSDLLTPIGTTLEFMTLTDGGTGAGRREQSAQAMAKALEQVLGAAADPRAKQEEFDQTARKDVERMSKGLHAALERQKSRFLELAAILNEKTLDLDDAERRYKETR